MKELPISQERIDSYFVYIEEERKSRDEQTVLNKINNIFKSESTLYSIDCIITFENNEAKYTIIGKTSNNLVTKSQKLIPIREIFDIELA